MPGEVLGAGDGEMDKIKQYDVQEVQKSWEDGLRTSFCLFICFKGKA